MNINPFIDLLGQIISLYNWALIIWIIMGWLIAFDILNRHQPIVYKTLYILTRLIDPVLKYIRRFIPPFGGIDFSAVILLLALGFLKNALYTYFYRL